MSRVFPMTDFRPPALDEDRPSDAIDVPAPARTKGMLGWRKILLVWIVVFLLFPILLPLEPVETFYEFSRSHETWELDELLLLFAHGCVALGIIAWLQSRRMRRLVAQLDEAHREAAWKATHDALTGTLNRHAFDALVAAVAARRGEPRTHVLLCIDLDRFKPVNDIFGHAVGDVVLRQVAERISDMIGQGSSLARVGGDEFVVLLPSGTPDRRAEERAARIAAAVGAPYEAENARVEIGCSIGLAHWRTDRPILTALVAADRALYEVKTDGSSVRWAGGDAKETAPVSIPGGEH